MGGGRGGRGLKEISQKTYMHIFLFHGHSNTVVKARGEGGGWVEGGKGRGNGGHF